MLGLEKKPWYFAAGAGLLVGGGIFGLLYWQFTMPQKEEIKKMERQLADLQVKIQEGRAAEAMLPEFREEVARLGLELDKLLRILPSRRNTPDLLRRIRALTEQGDFELTRFTPGNFIDKDFYSEWPIQVSLEGAYHNLALFFDRIGRFSRIINIENLSIGALRKGVHTITASFVAKTFVYKEPSAEGDKGKPAPTKPAAKPRPPARGGGD